MLMTTKIPRLVRVPYKPAIGGGWLNDGQN
jgi:hypothetical protein